MINSFRKAWQWYQRRVIESMLISTIILYLQIPHTISAAECFFAHDQHHILFGHNPLTDFLLYGIDLLELIPIVAMTTQLIAQIQRKRNGQGPL